MPLRPSAAAAMTDPEAGGVVASTQSPVRPPSADGPGGGPSPGPIARWIRSIHSSRVHAKRAYALHPPGSGGGGGSGGTTPHAARAAAAAHQQQQHYHAAAAAPTNVPKTLADHKLVAQYNSQATVLGSSAAVQMNQFKFDDVGRRQVALEERFVLQRGIIHPYNKAFRAWWWLTIFAAAVTGWIVPYTIAFLPLHDGPGTAAYGIEAALLAIFLGDMVSSFFVARYDKGVLIGDRRTLIKIYLRFRFWWDILTVMPWDWIVLSGLGLMGSNTAKAHFVSLLALLKLGRMYRIDRLYRHLEFSLALPLVVTKLTRIATYAFFLIHWAGCAFWFIARQEQLLGYSSWLTAINEGDKSGMGIEGLSVWEQYTYSVWWAASTFYPVGAGHNIAPYTLAEVVFTMVFLALNILLWGFILGSISLLVARSDESSAKYRQRMHALERYGRDKGLPQDMRELIEGHLRLNFTTNQEADEQMLLTLPTTLRRRILRYLYGDHLKRCWLLSDVKPKFFDALLGVARLETFMPQVELFTEGDEVNELYFIVAGYVEVFASAAAAEQSDKESLDNAALYSRSPSTLMNDVSVGKYHPAGGTSYSLLGPGDVVGEVAFFTEVPQLELVRSLTVCRALVVPRPAYAALAADFPMSATAILVALQKNAERAVSAEFRGGAASRLLRGSLVASLPGLTFQHTSAETMGQQTGGTTAAAAPAGGRFAAGAGAAGAAAVGRPTSTTPDHGKEMLSGQNSVGGLTVRQQQVIGNLQRIRAVVKHHVAQADESRTGQFLSAAAKGQVDRVKLLLQQGYNANTADYDKRTALMLAAGNGHKAVVDMLLSVNVNLNARDQQGNSALLEAARNGQEEIIVLLMSRGARLNLDGQAQAHEMCAAITRGDIITLRNLLRCNADPNSLDYDRRAPLHIAAADGNLQAVKILVEEGKARVDVKSRNGNTPLDVAHLASATAVVTFLETKVSGAEAAAARKKVAARRADALLRAAAVGDAATVQAVLDSGCPPDAADYDRRTGLMLAAANGHRDVVLLLLGAGSNPNTRDNLGGSALLEAVKGGWDELIGVLVAAGGGLQLSGGELASALCEMVKADQPYLLRRYIEAGADVNAADYDKRTPLHIAAAEGKLSMVQLLVAEGGADLAAADRWGNTPLTEATRVGAADVAAYLKSKDAKAAAVAARQAAADRLQASRRYGLRASAGGTAASAAAGGSSLAGLGGVSSPTAAAAAGEAEAGGHALTPLQRSTAGAAPRPTAAAAAGPGGDAMGRVESQGDAAIDAAVRQL